MIPPERKRLDRWEQDQIWRAADWWSGFWWIGMAIVVAVGLGAVVIDYTSRPQPTYSAPYKVSK